MKYSNNYIHLIDKVIVSASPIFILKLTHPHLRPVNLCLQRERLHKYAIECVWKVLTLFFRCPLVVDVNNLLLVAAVTTGLEMTRSCERYLVGRATQLKHC